LVVPGSAASDRRAIAIRVLRDVEGWSNQEVAYVLDLSLAATKSRIHRGRMRIREELDAWRKAAEANPPTGARRRA